MLDKNTQNKISFSGVILSVQPGRRCILNWNTLTIIALVG